MTDSASHDPAALAPPGDRAAQLARGTARLFAGLGHSCLAEFRLRNGRRADLIAVAPDGGFTIVEIKSSVADYRADRKWRDYLPYCDWFYFCVPEEFPQDILPEETGLIVADAYGAAVLRESDTAPMHASRRRALTLRYARTAGRRLMRHVDPAFDL
jgi:hypothetical protein